MRGSRGEDGEGGEVAGACVRNGGMGRRKRGIHQSFCEAWEWESAACHESPHIRHHNGVMESKTAGPMISIDFSVLFPVCVCV